MNRTKKRHVFWPIYFGVVALVIFAITIGASVLISWLDAFEQSQPIHAAEAVYKEYFEGEKWSELLKLANYKKGPLEQNGEAQAALAALKKGKDMSFYSVGGDDLIEYNVILTSPKDGNKTQKIASFTVKKSEKAGRYGLYGYEFDSAKVFLDRKESVEIVIPAHYTLYAGENEITSDPVSTTPHAWNEHLPDDVPGVDYATYRFEELLKVPTFSVKDENGSDVALTADESGVLKAELVMASDVDPALSQRLLTGMETYAAYMQDDGSIGAVGKYFDKESDFYKSAKANPSSFVWDHNGYEFQNERVENFFFFNENTLCCSISFDQVLKMTGRENYVDRLSMTVYAKNVNGTWYIFNCVNN